MKKSILLTVAVMMASSMWAGQQVRRFTSLSQLTPEVIAGLRSETGTDGREMLDPAKAPAARPGARSMSDAAPVKAKSVVKKSLSGAKFTGWLSANEYEDGGYYQLDSDGAYKMLWSNNISSIGINLLNGWIKDGKLCGLGSYSSGGMVFYYNYLEFDLSTGQPLKEEAIGADNLINLTNYYLSSTYVAAEDRVYGYTYASEEGSGYNFCSSPADNIADVTVIKTLTDNTERTSAICYNPEDGLFYGVNYYGQFVSVDHKGVETVLFDLDLMSIRTDPSAIVYSPLDGCFVYCAYYYDYATQLYFIRPEKKETEFIMNFPSDFEFTFLLNEDLHYDASAPGRAQLVSFNVEPGALSGDAVYSLPSTTAGGDVLSGTLGWTLYVDNTVYASGSGNAGENVTVELNAIAQGLHVFRFVASVDGKEGLTCVDSRYFGNGVPMAPANVTITDTQASWDAVTEAEYGAYIDLSKLQYDVYVNGEYVGSTSETSYALKLDPEKTYSAYIVAVAAKCNGLTSSRTESDKLLYGAPMSLPYHITPTQAEADLTISINADGSPSYGEWGFSESRWFEPVFYSGWNLVDADDWLILPPVDCSDITHAFRITLDAVCGGMASPDERFEVWCGQAPTVEAMKTLIIPETKVSKFITEGWDTFSNLFLPAEAGPCYIAIRAVTPASGYSLLVRNITIEATDELADVPMAPSDMKLVEKSDADLTVTVSFTMPVQTIAGNTIATGASLKAILKTGENVVEQDAAPGQSVTLTVKTSQGLNRVEALASLNGQSGQGATLEVFTGTIPPNYVENLSAVISEDNLSIYLKWDAPTEGQENLEGYYSPEGLSYWLYERLWDDYYEVYQWLPVKELGNVNEYTYSVASDARMATHYIGIVAANVGGVSDALSYVFKVIGRPYDSIDEHFDDGMLHYGPLVIKTPSADYQNSGWDMVAPEDVSSAMWSADVPYAMIGYTDNEEGGGMNRLALPKVNPSAVSNPVLSLILWTGQYSGVVSVYATSYDNQTSAEKIFDVPAYNAKWETVEVAIPAKYADKKWLELSLDCALDSYYTYTLLGGYSFGEGTTALPTTAAGLKASVRAENGAVVASGFADGTVLSVYGVDGTLMAKAIVVNGYAEAQVPDGLYVVSCGSERTKLYVH